MAKKKAQSQGVQVSEHRETQSFYE